MKTNEAVQQLEESLAQIDSLKASTPLQENIPDGFQILFICSKRYLEQIQCYTEILWT